MKVKFFKRLTACAVALFVMAAMLPLNAAAENTELNYTAYYVGNNEGDSFSVNHTTKNYTVVTSKILQSTG